MPKKRRKTGRKPVLNRRSKAFKLFSSAGKKGRKALMEKMTPEARIARAKKAAAERHKKDSST